MCPDIDPLGSDLFAKHGTLDPIVVVNRAGVKAEFEKPDSIESERHFGRLNKRRQATLIYPLLRPREFLTQSSKTCPACGNATPMVSLATRYFR